MGTTLYQWLQDAEDALLRMIKGVFRFVSEEFPHRIYQFVFETVGPVTIRLARVLGLACLWLMILLSPFVVGVGCNLPWWWCVGSVAWAGLAIAGSVWGLGRALRKRKADLCAIKEQR